MCIYVGHRCICIPNMTFACLNPWLGELCTDDANTNYDAQSMIAWVHMESTFHWCKIVTLHLVISLAVHMQSECGEDGTL